LSALFNSFIFVRGCEDRNLDRTNREGRALLSAVASNAGTEVNLISVLTAALLQTGVTRSLADFVDLAHLQPFSAVDHATALNLCRDFYAPSDAAYDFNFALMSKHALSRIYERYVALLKSDTEDEGQLHFISPTPTEIAPDRSGSVYTPQFIAGFFSRYIWLNTTPRTFRALRTIDPACGSGIFLRTLLELQCNPMIPGTTPATIREAFSRAEGIDHDPNAVGATRLSLALLYLVATGDLPQNLNIRRSDAIAEAVAQTFAVGTYGAVVTNPPYVKYDHLSQSARDLYRQYLDSKDAGRVDAYVPFVKLSLQLAEPDGLVCIVLPQVFLNARNSSPLRRIISEEFDIRCLVDLSPVRIFEHVSTYNILLIAQRRQPFPSAPTIAYIAQITEFVGAALEACLRNQTIETPYYRVFGVGQSFLRAKNGYLLARLI
jgi:N-6 DNA Methylase